MKRPSKSRKNPAKRPLGLYRDQIWMAPDFDAPMKFVEVNGDMLLVPDRARATKKKGKRQTPSQKSSQR
jgi:hypothetical protein